EVWLHHTDKAYYEKYKDRVELHQPWYEGTALGLVVPEYVEEVETIADLNKHKELFRRGDQPAIVRSDWGASLMMLTEKAIQTYSLDYELIESSEPVMLSELDKAYKKKEPVVVTLWNPHSVFNKYKLKYLKDPEKVYGEPDTIYYVTRKGFKQEHPEVIQWMDRWEMDDNTLGELMKNMEDTDNPEQAVRQWLEKHRDLVNEWVEENLPFRGGGGGGPQAFARCTSVPKPLRGWRKPPFRKGGIDSPCPGAVRDSAKTAVAFSMELDVHPPPVGSHILGDAHLQDSVAVGRPRLIRLDPGRQGDRPLKLACVAFPPVHP